MERSTNHFARYAWGLLAYNLLVILWGAFVRATGSGAGCGAHWPLCNGEVIPRAPAVETMIEFTHRISSGLVVLLVVGLIYWAWRKFPRGHLLRVSSAVVGFFTLTEALVGAGLVLFEMVADNTSIARAWWMIAHLLNTFLLLASLSITAHWATFGTPKRFHWRRATGIPLVVGFLAMLILGASGAVTALGDTLYPASSLAEGFQQDFHPEAALLVRLRIWHPVIAVLVGAYLVAAGVWIRSRLPTPAIRRASYVLIGLFVIQLFFGAINVILLAPVWMQLVHLLTADLVWISFVFLSLYVFRTVQLTPRATDHPIHDRINQTAQ